MIVLWMYYETTGKYEKENNKNKTESQMRWAVLRILHFFIRVHVFISSGFRCCYCWWCYCCMCWRSQVFRAHHLLPLCIHLLIWNMFASTKSYKCMVLDYYFFHRLYLTSPPPFPSNSLSIMHGYWLRSAMCVVIFLFISSTNWLFLLITQTKPPALCVCSSRASLPPPITLIQYTNATVDKSCHVYHYIVLSIDFCFTIQNTNLYVRKQYTLTLLYQISNDTRMRSRLHAPKYSRETQSP